MGLTRLSLILGYTTAFIWWAFLQFDAHLTQLKIQNFSVGTMTFILLNSVALYFHIRKIRLPTKRGLYSLLVGIVLMGLFGFGGAEMFSVPGVFILYLFTFISWNGLVLMSNNDGDFRKSLQFASILCAIFTLLTLQLSGATSAGFFDATRFLILFLPLSLTSLIVISVVIMVRKYYEDRIISWMVLVVVGYTIYLVSSITLLQTILLDFSTFPLGIVDFLNTVGTFVLAMGILGILHSPHDLVFGKHAGVTYFRDITYKVPVSLN